MNIDLSGMFTALIFFGALIVGVPWICWELIDYFFIDDSIKSEHLITPEIQLIIKNNIVDTLYIYRQP